MSDFATEDESRDVGDLPDVAEVTDAGASDASGPVDQGTSVDMTPDMTLPAVPDCQTSTFTTVDGTERAYILCLPDPLPIGPLPIVLGFHGGGGNATTWQRGRKWEETGAAKGFGVVYMQGCRSGWTDCTRVFGSYLWNVGKPGYDSSSSRADDEAYTLEVIARLTDVHGLDIGPVFATGHSLGGIFTYTLRCDQPDLFAAIGPMSASPSDETCTSTGDTSIYHLHGGDDPNVPFATGCCSADQKDSTSSRYLPGCDTMPVCFNGRNWWPPALDGNHPFADLVGIEEMAVESLGCLTTRVESADQSLCESYNGCRAGTAVEICLVPGAGHGLGQIDSAIDLRSHLWSRFARHL